MGLFSGLLSAGASIVGGLFGRKKSEPQVTKSHVDYKRMVRDAEAAGFNPLTALRNGGAAGFSVQSTSAPLSSPSFGETIAGAAQNFLANFDPFEDRQREAEYGLVQAQIANLNSDTSLKRVRFGDVPTYSGDKHYKRLGSSVGHGQTFEPVVGALPASAGVSQTPEVKRPTLTNPYPASWGWFTNPDRPDAEAMETRMGDNEMLSMGWSLYAGVDDAVYNSVEKTKSFRDGNRKPLFTITPVLSKPMLTVDRQTLLPKSWHPDGATAILSNLKKWGAWGKKPLIGGH